MQLFTLFTVKAAFKQKEAKIHMAKFSITPAVCPSEYSRGGLETRASYATTNVTHLEVNA